jgi:MFS transporter, AAHS family, vanillate permease
MNNDPREALATNPMNGMQMLVVAITMGLAALDGLDILSISFASPGIALEWGIDRQALGVVLSMELFGMALGSILLGGVADWIGRRQTLLGCLLLMAVGMFMVAGVHGLTALCIWRVVTGLGIGGMLAAINAVAAEFSNVRGRDLSVSLMVIGYPLGAVLGGSVIARMLQHGSWRLIFEFGGFCTAAFLPIVFWWVPESVSWLCQKQPARALERVNRSLARLRMAPIAMLPPRATEQRRGTLVDLFRSGLAVTTVMLALTYFLHVTTFYFMLKWVPKIIVDLGFAPSSAAGVLVWTNVGGAIGGATLGLAAQRFGLKTITIALFVGSGAMVTVFGHGAADLVQLSVICALSGFFINGGIAGMYILVARAFPTDLRASGTGFVIGVGRGGAMLAPIVAGLLFHAGFGLQSVAILMSVGSLGAAICLALLPARALTVPVAAADGSQLTPVG